MSASLVGSEMCIRDRAATADASELRERAAFLKYELLTSVLQRTWGTGSVSYTHLTLPTICSV
eukprot:13670680-Alexandrium_andersonii.AAC.1